MKDPLANLRYGEERVSINGTAPDRRTISERIERAIVAIAPSWGARRAGARSEVLRAAVAERAFRSFEAASSGRRTAGWTTSGTSINSDTEVSLEKLRQRSRHLTANNPWAAGATNTLTTRSIGVGIRPKAVTTSSKRRARRADDLWLNWAETTEIDPQEGVTVYGLQSLAFRSMISSGEVLARRRPRRVADGLTVPLQIELLEADHLDSGKNRLDADSSGSRIIQGIEFDSRGRRLAYWLFPQHPGERGSFRSSQSVRVPAKDIIHLREPLRPGQVRGLPRGTSALIKLRDWDLYDDAQLQRQQIAACFTAFVYDSEASDPAANVQKNNLSEEFRPATIQHLPPGKEITFADPPGVDGFTDYATITLRQIARGWRVSYEALAGDYSAVNFSSARMSSSEMLDDIEAVRLNFFVPQFCDRVYLWMVEAARTAGLLDSDDVWAKWTPPRRLSVDPSKEIPAKVKAVRAGLTSLSDAIRETGRNPREVLEELRDDLKLVDELGLTIESDGRIAVAGSAPAKDDGSEDKGSSGKDGEED